MRRKISHRFWVRWSLTSAIAACALATSLRVAQTAETSSALAIAQQLNDAFVEVAETVSPTVVVIEVAQKMELSRMHRDNPLWELLPPELRRQYQEELEKELEKQPKETNPHRQPQFNGSGSGVVIRKNGYILTNTHVVEDAEKIKVRFKDGKEFEPTGVWTDPQSDIAVLKIDADNLAVAKLGDSAKTRVGEFAIAIGAPFVLDYSVTFGHVSAKGRQQIIPATGADSIGAKMDQDFIQTDASINPGNSGGPLVNIRGEVIGVNTLIRGLGTGIGFAVPVNRAKDVAEQLISDGKVARAWLGIATQPFKESRLRSLVEGVSQGLVVDRIQTNGPAFKSELKSADIITSVEDQPVTSVQELRDAVRSKKIGSTISLDVVRLESSGKTKNLKIKIKTEAWPSEEIAAVNPPKSNEPERVRTLGLNVKTLTDELAEKYGIKKVDGVVVIDVKPDSPAAAEGFKPGDVITQVGRKTVTTPKQFRDAVKAAGSKGVLIDFISEGASEYRIITEKGD